MHSKPNSMFNGVSLRTIQDRNENKTHLLNQCIMFNIQDTFRARKCERL